MRTFNTVLHRVKSPQNVGMIIRSHVAFGGDKVIFVGYEEPWKFKKGSQAFSRKLESSCQIKHFRNDLDFFNWSEEQRLKNLAIEITESSELITNFNFTESSNLIVGNEAIGLPTNFLEKCDAIITIPQFGFAECLNVAVSASIAMHEFMRCQFTSPQKIMGVKFSL